MMNAFAQSLTAQLSAGVSMNTALAVLRDSGATPIQTIAAIHEATDVSLGEAKRIFCACPAWAAEVAAGDRLHEQILSNLGHDL